MNLKQQIITANEAYRKGNPIMSDAEYDILLNKLEDEMNIIEFELFKQTLMEESGTYKHKYVVGSLNKIKAENPEDLDKFVNKHHIKTMIVSEKVDGVSVYVSYKNGMLTQVASRGDGYCGSDWFDKGKHFLPNTITYKKDLDIRGELTLIDETHKMLGFKNKRNGTVGILNSKTIEPNKLKYIKAYFYQILNSEVGLETQFNQLINYGFNTPRFKIVEIL